MLKFTNVAGTGNCGTVKDASGAVPFTLG
jgi:hypothetical protein